MVIVMNMDTCRHIADEFGAFEEEVLNAQWLPQPLQAAPRLGLQESAGSVRTCAASTQDADAFLRNIYLCQE